MQSAPGIVQKACLIPVCQGRKFQLVHKFPSDKERFAEWVEAIQKDQKVKQLSGDLNDEQIRKRYFICSRHFGLNQYKNIESRSLNITALPHLNLVDLDKLQESKAYRVEDQPDPIVDEDMLKNQKSSPAKCAQQTVRILNSEIVKTDNKLGNEIVRVSKRPAPAAKPQTNEHVFKEPRAKKVKVLNNSLMILKQKSYEIKSKEIQIEPIVEKLEMPPETENIEPVAEDEIVEEPVKPTLKRVSTQKKSPPKKKESPKSKQATQKLQNGEEKSEKPEKTEEEPSPPANKLLALVEVTPEQYEKLSKSLSSAQRNEQISSLLNFIDKEDTELESADNGNFSLPNLIKPSFTFYVLSRQHASRNFCGIKWRRLQI